MSLGVGTEIGGYRIGRAIGEGGMSIVYLAEALADGREVVLKVLRDELADNKDFRKRFLRESGYMVSLDHPNVVPVYDAGEDGSSLYIAMQYVPGTDLYALLQAGPLEPELALAILGQVASALDAAHAAGLLHRDVKPGNVLVASGAGSATAPHCYLTDFGLSKHTEKDSVALTGAGDFVGTIYYTAPEQMLAKGATKAADVYSLACLLFECLAGEPPFTGATEVDVMAAHIERPPPKLSDRRPGTPPELDDVLVKALAKDPAGRHASCGELLQAARAVIEPALPVVAGGSGPPAGGGGDMLRLKVTEGNAAGSEIEVTDELVIGRQAEGAGKLGDDIEISRRHARISRTDNGEYEIEDLGSTNGTVLNGRRLERPELLYAGDRIEVGGSQLVVQVRSTSTAPPTEAAVAEPEPPTEQAPPAEAPPAGPRLSLRLEVDLASGEARIELDESSEPVRLIHEDGRWRLAP